MPTRIITVTELKTRFGARLAELERDGVPLYVTQYGKPRAVLVGYDDYERLLARLEAADQEDDSEPAEI